MLKNLLKIFKGRIHQNNVIFDSPLVELIKISKFNPNTSCCTSLKQWYLMALQRFIDMIKENLKRHLLLQTWMGIPQVSNKRGNFGSRKEGNIIQCSIWIIINMKTTWQKTNLERKWVKEKYWISLLTKLWRQKKPSYLNPSFVVISSKDSWRGNFKALR